jgi:hypothetical protein
MVVCQSIKLLLGARGGIEESLVILETALKELAKFAHKQDILGPQKKTILNICEFVKVFSRFLERSLLSETSVSSLRIDRKLQKEVIHWTQMHMEDMLLFRGILLPVFGQICAHADNESAGFALIEVLSQGNFSIF